MPVFGTENVYPHRLKGRPTRSRSIGTKLTPEEEAKILAAAEADRKAPSEWVREKLLAFCVAGGGSASILDSIFTDLVGLQMMFMNVLAPFIAGERISQERVDQIFHEIQKAKFQAAREILARRAQVDKPT